MKTLDISYETYFNSADRFMLSLNFNVIAVEYGISALSCQQRNSFWWILSNHATPFFAQLFVSGPLKAIFFVLLNFKNRIVLIKQ